MYYLFDIYGIKSRARPGDLILTIHGGKMKIEKRVLGDASLMLGKVTCQNSPNRHDGRTPTLW